MSLEKNLNFEEGGEDEMSSGGKKGEKTKVDPQAIRAITSRPYWTGKKSQESASRFHFVRKEEREP